MDPHMVNASKYRRPFVLAFALLAHQVGAILCGRIKNDEIKTVATFVRRTGRRGARDYHIRQLRPIPDRALVALARARL